MLLALLVALTCAIVCNVAFMIRQQIALTSLPSGVAEDKLVMIQSVNLDRQSNQIEAHKTDLAALRMIPGVEGVAAVDALPFNGNNWTSSVPPSQDAPGNVGASLFNGTPDEVKTLGLDLVAGRDFRPDEYIPLDSAHGFDGLDHVPAAILTRSLAERLFPGQNPLGKSIWPGDGAVRIVGVVSHLLRPDVGTGNDNDYSVLLPMLPDTASITYALRTAPQNRARVLKQAKAALYRVDANRVLRDATTFTELRAHYFRRQRSMIGLLIASALGLLLVAALGSLALRTSGSSNARAASASGVRWVRRAGTSCATSRPKTS